jgi:hypothetical protein
MNIPIELLTCIASELGSIDLSNFRLVNHAYAQAAISLIPRYGISVLNISRDIKALQNILQCPAIATNVKILRVFHAEWPICSRAEWETHDLLFGGNERIRTSHQFPTSASARRLYKQAFAAYKELLIEQQCRRYSEEIKSLFQILKMLHNLTTIQVSDMHDYLWHPKTNRRYHRLQRSIWISPFYSNIVTRTVESVLIASRAGIKNLGQVKEFHISGAFDPRELNIQHTVSNYSHIQQLKIHDFQMCENEMSIRTFLRGFPELRTLSVSFQGWGPSIDIFKLLHWHQLEQLDIRALWTSESEFISILERHSKSLKQFSLHNPALTQGSWQSLFTKIRALDTQARIVLSGELFGRTSRETLNMECDQTQIHIAEFLRNRNSIWPFCRD